MGGLIIKSNSNKAFCSGLDTKCIQKLSNEEAAEFFVELSDLLEKISNFSCPTISICNGHVYGAGADLALSCDIRIGHESTTIRFPGPQFGVILGTHRLVSEVGSSIARKLTFTNKTIGAYKSLQYGIIHTIVPQNEDSLKIAISEMEKMAHLTTYTMKSIRSICDGNSYNEVKTDASKYTKQSILQGDFQKRLQLYIKRMQQKQ